MDATRVSDRLFGRGCRLPLAAWVAQHPKGRFFQSEAPTFGTTSRSNVNQELQRLLELGMLEVERPDETKKVFYVRSKSPLWDVVRLAAEILQLTWADGTVDLGHLDD